MNLSVERRWSCPNCTATHVSHEPTTQAVSKFHSCAGLNGLTAPFVPDGTSCKVEAREREDWVGKELVQTDGEGRPVMSIVTTRETGQDCTVFAPCATARSE